jgi:hypothetical protein
MTQKILFGFAIAVLGVWVWFCQRQIDILTVKPNQPNVNLRTAEIQPNDNLKAAEIQLEAVKLAEANRQKAKQEDEAKKKEQDEIKRKYAVAIETALKERNQAQKDSRIETKKGTTDTTLPDEKEFLKRLRRISVSDCPTRFQVVWADYVYILGKDQNLVHKVSEISSAARGDLSVLDSHDVPDAWHRCEIVALEYGVSLSK